MIVLRPGDLGQCGCWVVAGSSLFISCPVCSEELVLDAGSIQRVQLGSLGDGITPHVRCRCGFFDYYTLKMFFPIENPWAQSPTTAAGPARIVSPAPQPKPVPLTILPPADPHEVMQEQFTMLVAVAVAGTLDGPESRRYFELRRLLIGMFETPEKAKGAAA